MNFLPTWVATAVALANSGAGFARAQAQTFELDPDTMTIDSLPAISADGRTIAVVEYFETVSNAQRLVVEFVPIGAGNIERWLIYEARDDGSPLASPSDGLGRTSWRRLRNLEARLRAGGYRTLTAIVDLDRAYEDSFMRGEGIIIEGPTRFGRVRVFDVVTGRRLARHDSGLPGATLTHVWVDADRRAILLEAGYVFASCMEPNDMHHVAVPIERW